MTELKMKNRALEFFKNFWRQTRFCIRSFLLAVCVLAFWALILYITLCYYISSGGLNLFASLLFSWVYFGFLGFSLCLYLWAVVCLILSVFKPQRIINLIFIALGAIFINVINKECAVPAVNSFFGQPDRDIDILRYYAHNEEALGRLQEFGKKVQSFKTDEKFIFSEQSVKDLSDLDSFDNEQYRYIFSYPDFDFNKNLLGLKPSQISPDVVMLFQSKNDNSPFSGPDDISAEWHYDKGSLIVFGDGRIEFVKKENFKNLRWQP